MKDLEWDLWMLCEKFPEGSYETRHKREKELRRIGRTLTKTLGFRGMRLRSIKPRHVKCLVEHWKEQDLKVSTIKNRMSYLRWWVEKIGKKGVVSRRNSDYGIEARKYVTNESKANQLDKDRLAKIEDPYVSISIRLAAAFGLRKEEAIKFNPKYAIQGDEIRLKASWCKGRKARCVPIRTNDQRALLEEALMFVGNRSLIPTNKTYIEQRRRYEHITKDAGFRKLHGLRHQYAQERYLELTGWLCPVSGGPSRKCLSDNQKEIDRQARLTISIELGHERLSIAAIYIGS